MAHSHRQAMDVGGLRGDQLKFGLREGGGSQLSQQDEASVDTTSLPLDNLAPGGAWARPKLPADKLRYLKSFPKIKRARLRPAPALDHAPNQGGCFQ